eukprot:TRINITY_DN9408_c0_g2_i1.p1 TRINITY_DN9408_c0_g2~~TRINITY_DN9408_c0_g2_i1.p1  ORF type:complete len:193 (-),score=12.37 TRINITY_DN9408_c0_g2_i1:209-787(-)
MVKEHAKQYKASDATVEKMLRLHRQRKYLEIHGGDISVNCDHVGVKAEEFSPGSYYMVDFLNKNQNEYKTLNRDVALFAGSHNRIHCIHRSTRNSSKVSTKVVRKDPLKSAEPEKVQNDLNVSTAQRRKSHDVSLKFPQIQNKFTTSAAHPILKKSKRSKSFTRKRKYKKMLNNALKIVKVLAKCKVECKHC